jgi:putative transcriptional regulator
MSKLGKRLIDAAREARAIVRGEADPSTYRVHVPTDIDVRKIRQQLGLSQDEFAARFALSVATVREWEQDRRRPEGAARVLLTVIDKDPDAVARALTAAMQPAEQISRPVARQREAGVSTSHVVRGTLSGGVKRVSHSGDTLLKVAARGPKQSKQPRQSLRARTTTAGKRG